MTGTYGGCGKLVYVPCGIGRDCADCGRSVSVTVKKALGRTTREMMAINRTSWSLNEVMIDVPAYPGGFPSVPVALTAHASTIGPGTDSYASAPGATRRQRRRMAEARAVAEELTAQCEDEGGYHDAVNHGTLPAVADREQFERMLAHVHFGLRNGTIVEAKLPDPHQFWLERFDPERLGVEPFESRKAMQTAFANFVANRRR